jgi:transcriptional regulator with XRE-family HTH domain
MTEIRRLRKKRGLSVKRLASLVGITAMSIYRYEQGRRMPDVDVAAKIATALNCQIEDLLKTEKAG